MPISVGCDQTDMNNKTGNIAQTKRVAVLPQLIVDEVQIMKTVLISWPAIADTLPSAHEDRATTSVKMQSIACRSSWATGNWHRTVNALLRHPNYFLSRQRTSRADAGKCSRHDAALVALVCQHFSSSAMIAA